MITLDQASIEAIAESVASRLGATLPFPRLLSTAEVARELAMTPAWVRAHATELGVIRVGTGPKPRLLFDLAVALERLASCSAHRGSAQGGTGITEPKARRRHPRAMGTSTQLLPVRAPESAKSLDARPAENENDSKEDHP